MPATLPITDPHAAREALLRRAQAQLELGLFQYFIPRSLEHKRWLTPGEVTQILPYRRSAILRLSDETITDENRLPLKDAHGRPVTIYKLERAKLERVKRGERRFTMRGVVLFLMEMMENPPEGWLPRLKLELGRHRTADLMSLRDSLNAMIAERGKR
jgi:hypothetical protein